MDSSIERMKELTKLLKEASRAYYHEAREKMSNLEYDRLYDELEALEEETGIVMADSPTVRVGYEVLSELPKEAHETPMLSLNKTKSVDELADFAGAHKSLLSWKLDGLTVVLTYQEGKLLKAMTRGNGEVGEVITPNAKAFKNIPLSIPFKGKLVIRGEALIRYSDFEKINREMGDIDAKYKNPRNLCSGSVRQLNSEITAKRNIHFYAYSLVTAEGMSFQNSREAQFQWMRELGFAVVEYKVVTQDNMRETVSWFAEKIKTFDLPSDGLVLLYDDMEYGASLGRTAKFPRDSIAFKWADETAETTLKEIEWSASRTGLINPVAIFEAVELEGTTVSRASVHNLSVMKQLALGIGDKILVYKANMIIPQIAENFTKSGNVEIPARCPVCGGKTAVHQSNDIECLYCENEYCQAKKIKAFSLMVSRDALNIEGLSEATLEKFIACGYIREFADIYQLQRHEQEIQKLEGFGEKSCQKLLINIEKSRTTTLERYLYSLGILNIGLSGAKLLVRHYHGDWDALLAADCGQLSEIDGIGPVIAQSFVEWRQDVKKRQEADNLLRELKIEKEERLDSRIFEGMAFVITGGVEQFENRKALKAFIEERAGKVTASVSKNTSYLINNDLTSSSSKNKKAKELSIPIISEAEFLSLARRLETS